MRKERQFFRPFRDVRIISLVPGVDKAFGLNLTRRLANTTPPVLRVLFRNLALELHAEVVISNHGQYDVKECLPRQQRAKPVPGDRAALGEPPPPAIV